VGFVVSSAVLAAMGLAFGSSAFRPAGRVRWIWLVAAAVISLIGMGMRMLGIEWVEKCSRCKGTGRRKLPL